MQVKAYNFKRARIEIVPLIDVIFFLLATFVMVSLSMTKNQGVQVQLPNASTAEKIEDRDKAATLTVRQNGEIFFNKDKVTLAQLPFKLQTYKAASKDPKVVVSAEANANFRNIVAVLDEARKVGILKVGISTEKK
ncbi:MAG: biopolymer transporter ExbD [bacterium]